MTQITVAAADVIEYKGNKTPATARLFANVQFTTSDGEIVEAGSKSRPQFYQELTASLVGDKIRIASGVVHTTTDSSNPAATYSLSVYDDRGRHITDVFSNIRIAPDNDPTTWETIELSQGRPQRYPSTYLDSKAILKMFNNIVNGAAKASEVQQGVVRLDTAADTLSDPIAVGTNSPLLIPPDASVVVKGKTLLDTAPADPAIPIAVGVNSDLVAAATAALLGRTRLDTAPADPANPIAVGVNNPIFEAIQETRYMSEFASVAAAITEIGATPTELRITEDVAVPATATFPATTILSFEGTGRLTVAAGQTLTIGLMRDPGNRQVFARADATAHIHFAPGAVERMNVAWFAGPTPTLITDVIEELIHVAELNAAGTVYIPAGTWTTAGGHVSPGNFVLEGEGTGHWGANTELKLTNGSTAILTIGGTTYNTYVRGINLNGDNLADTYGVYCAGNYPDSSRGLNCEGVIFKNFTTGLRVESLSGDWQFAAINIDQYSIFDNNSHSDIRCNAINSAFSIDANFFTAPNAWALYFEKVGGVTVRGSEFAGAFIYTGQNQVETQTVVGGVTGDGVARSVVTGAGLPNSPVTVEVDLTTAAHGTATAVATAIRTALANNPYVKGKYAVGGTGAKIELMNIDAEVNDGTMNFTIENVTTTGITDNVTSTTEVTGAVHTNLPAGVCYIGGEHLPITFIGTQDEGYATTLYVAPGTSTQNSVVNYFGCLTQHPIRLNGPQTVNAFGSKFALKAFRDSVASTGSYVYTIGCHVPNFVLMDGFRSMTPQFTNFIGDATFGASIHTKLDLGESDFRTPVHIVQDDLNFFTSGPMLSVLRKHDQPALQIGNCDSGGNSTGHYDFKRGLAGGATGRLQIEGSQDLNNTGIDFDGDIRPVKISSSGAPELTSAATIDIDARLGNVFSLTPAHDATINIDNLVSGQPIALIITTSGTTSYTLTFGTGFKTTGTLITGAVSGKVFQITFNVSKDGGAIEAARTTAM